MTILDIAYPYDFYISETYELKLEKYKSLQAFIEREMMTCICDVVIIGPLGTIHKNALKVLIEMEIPKNDGKRFVYYTNTSQSTKNSIIYATKTISE